MVTLGRCCRREYCLNIFGILRGYKLDEYIAGINSLESAAKNENADELRSQLSTLAFDAYEKYYLPHELGGGAKSFQSIPGDDGNLRNIRLSDLKDYNSDKKNYYMLAPLESHSVIKIYGIGNKQGDDPNFENVDGQQGKIQIAVEIAPPGDLKFTNSNY